MTRTTNARIAGFTYLFYAAIGICSEVLMHQARGAGGSDVAKLAHIGQYATNVRLTVLITLLECFSALVLAVTLYAITRDVDHELAMLVLVCRVAEGILGTLNIPRYLGLLWLAKAGAGTPLDIPTTNALRTFLMMPVPSVPIGSIFFAVGSTIFSWLLVRGRMVPISLAWLGVFASGLLAVVLPLQLAGFSTEPLSGYYEWLPALVFQNVLALWLLIKGVRTPAPHSGSSRLSRDLTFGE